jgi:hypothetical protein
MTNRGGPERPLSDGELARKFRDNIGRGLDASLAALVEASVNDLAKSRSNGLRDLMALLRS